MLYRISNPIMEEIGAINPNGIRLCVYAQETILLAPIHPFNKQIVPSLCP